MIIHRLALALSLAFVLASSSRAGAQGADATALEASGNKHFQLAEYDAAITDFKEAFRIADAPGYLYNIAQAYRLKGDCRNASTFYKNFLRRMPDAANAVKVRERITEMDACAATQPVTPPPTTLTPPTTPEAPVTGVLAPVQPPEPPPADQASSSGRGWMKYTGIASLGIGALGLGLGVKFMLDGKSANSDLKGKCAVTCTSAEANAIQDDGKSANRNAVVASVAGGAFVAAGVVMLVLSRSGGESERSPAISITRGGATASYAWSF